MRAPAARAIRVGSSNGQIVLSGVAGNAVAADRAVEVAKTMVPEGGSIVNAMKVAPSQQVMLRVRFLEVARCASRELGVNWFGANNAGNRGFATGVGAAHARGAGLRLPVLTQAEIRYPRQVRPRQRCTGLPIFTTAATLLSGAQPFRRRAGKSCHQGGQP